MQKKQDTRGVKVDYREGFEDGIKFAREVIINNIRKWAEDCIDGSEADVMDEVADKIEFGTLDNDA
jgi:hypothetical protein